MKIVDVFLLEFQISEIEVSEEPYIMSIRYQNLLMLIDHVVLLDLGEEKLIVLQKHWNQQLGITKLGCEYGL